MNTGNNRRIGWIDCARGIGIFLIVLNHTVIGFWIVEHFINLFAVPFFFFLSGMTFHVRKDFWRFAWKKCRQLYIPYLLAGFVSILLYQALGPRLGTGQSLNMADFLINLRSLLYANSSLYDMSWNTPLWFLPALFAAVLVFDLLMQVRPRWLRLVLVWLLSILGIVLAQERILLPFHMDTVFSMQIWMYLGKRSLKPFSGMDQTWHLWQKLLFFGLTAVAGFQIGFLNTDISIRAGNYGYNLLLYFGACFFLIGSMIALAQVFAACRPVEKVVGYMGRHTLAILLWHRFAATFFQILPFTRPLLEWPNWWRLFFSVIITSVVIGMCLVLEWLWKTGWKLLKRARAG